MFLLLENIPIEVSCSKAMKYVKKNKSVKKHEKTQKPVQQKKGLSSFSSRLVSCHTNKLYTHIYTQKWTESQKRHCTSLLIITVELFECLLQKNEGTKHFIFGSYRLLKVSKSSAVGEFFARMEPPCAQRMHRSACATCE